MSRARLVTVAVLVVIGVVLVAVGIVYVTITAPHLPSFIPGRAPNARRARHYNKRAIAAFVVAAVAFVAAFVVSRVPHPVRTTDDEIDA